MKKIDFCKPDISLLIKQGYTCVDMHFHSNYSDGAASINEIINKTKKLKIGVSVTDHNEIKGSLKLPEDVFVIPGIEVKSRELIDILFYFYDFRTLKDFYSEEIKPNKKKLFYTTKTTIPLKKLMNLKYKCVICVAHPYGYALRTSVTEVFSKYEHILKKSPIFEAINGGNMRKQNLKAVEYINANKKSFTGGSDGHSIYSLGNVVTCSKAKTVKEFLDNIKTMKNIVIGQEMKFGKLGSYFYFGKNKIKQLI